MEQGLTGVQESWKPYGAGSVGSQAVVGDLRQGRAVPGPATGASNQLFNRKAPVKRLLFDFSIAFLGAK